MTRYIEKYTGIATFVTSFIILFFMRNEIDEDSVNNLLFGFSNIISLVAVFLFTSVLVLIFNEGKKFIEIAKTSGAYQDLLRYILITAICCVISIALLTFAKLFELELLKLFAISVCFGSFTTALLVEFLFVKLMKLKSVF